MVFCLDPETKLLEKHEVSPNLGKVKQPLQTNKKRDGICKKSRTEKQQQMNGALDLGAEYGFEVLVWLAGKGGWL